MMLLIANAPAPRKMWGFYCAEKDKKKYESAQPVIAKISQSQTNTFEEKLVEEDFQKRDFFLSGRKSKQNFYFTVIFS